MGSHSNPESTKKQVMANQHIVTITPICCLDICSASSKVVDDAADSEGEEVEGVADSSATGACSGNGLGSSWPGISSFREGAEGTS